MSQTPPLSILLSVNNKTKTVFTKIPALFDVFPFFSLNTYTHPTNDFPLSSSPSIQNLSSPQLLTGKISWTTFNGGIEPATVLFQHQSPLCTCKFENLIGKQQYSRLRSVSFALHLCLSILYNLALSILWQIFWQSDELSKKQVSQLRMDNKIARKSQVPCLIFLTLSRCRLRSSSLGPAAPEKLGMSSISFPGPHLTSAWTLRIPLMPSLHHELEYTLLM